MASSPGRRSDALKDSEARVRALTREVGSLREDLRRETKRRERAVSQVRPACKEHSRPQAALTLPRPTATLQWP